MSRFSGPLDSNFEEIESSWWGQDSLAGISLMNWSKVRAHQPDQWYPPRMVQFDGSRKHVSTLCPLDPSIILMDIIDVIIYRFVSNNQITGTIPQWSNLTNLEIMWVQIPDRLEGLLLPRVCIREEEFMITDEPLQVLRGQSDHRYSSRMAQYGQVVKDVSSNG